MSAIASLHLAKLLERAMPSSPDQKGYGLNVRSLTKVAIVFAVNTAALTALGLTVSAPVLLAISFGVPLPVIPIAFVIFVVPHAYSFGTGNKFPLHAFSYSNSVIGRNATQSRSATKCAHDK